MPQNINDVRSRVLDNVQRQILLTAICNQVPKEEREQLIANIASVQQVVGDSDQLQKIMSNLRSPRDAGDFAHTGF